MTVSEIAAEFTVTRSAISQHLAVLGETELVAADKVGRQRIYRVLPTGLRKLQAEIAYRRFVADWHATRPQVGAGATPERASQRPSKGKAARQAHCS